MTSPSFARFAAVAAMVAASTAAPQAAHAAYTITVQQVGADVVATGSGSLGLFGLTFNSSTGPTVSQTNPSIGTLTVGSSAYDFYQGITGPTSFGPGGFLAASSSTGNFVAISATALGIAVPAGYVSGNPLATSTATWNSQTFASMGLTPGTYTWTWGVQRVSDSLTLRIGGAAVPEPSTWATMLLGMFVVGGMMRAARRRVALRTA